MTIEQIKLEIESLIAMGLDAEKERPKVEFKLRWPDLKSKPGISEFLKDTSAIANTVGLDGFLIFGYDPKTGKYDEVSFTDSKLKDQNEIRGLLTKGLSEPFDMELYTIYINGKNLDVLHIPPSVNKPHLIKQHRTYDKEGIQKTVEDNRILVRKNGGIYPAAKYDIDFMYYDRKNITPEYEAFVSVNLSKSIFEFQSVSSGGEGITIVVPLTVENTGRRPFIIEEIEFSLSLFGDEQPHKFVRELDPLYSFGSMQLKAQELFQQRRKFRCKNCSITSYAQGSERSKELQQNRKTLTISDFMILTSSGESIIPKVRSV
jgi:hypothetical protein